MSIFSKYNGPPIFEIDFSVFLTFCPSKENQRRTMKKSCIHCLQNGETCVDQLLYA